MKKIVFIFLLIQSIAYSQVYVRTRTIGPALDSSRLYVANTSVTAPDPQLGTLIQVVSSGVSTNARISMDTYNGSNVLGSVFQGRRAAGTASAPTAATTDYTLSGIVGDGYGDNSFHNISVGGIVIKANATFTNTSAPTYLQFLTSNTGSITAIERMRIKPDGTVQITGLNSVGFIQTDASGNLSTAALSSGNVTTALGYTPVTNARTVNGQALSSDVTVSTITGNAGTATTLQTARNINGLSFNGSADINTTQFIRLTSTYTLTSQTALQKLFNSTTNGAFNAAASTSYFFECEFDLSSMSATSGNFTFGFLGTATLTSIRYTAIASKTAIGTPSTAQIATFAVATASGLVTANTTTTGRAYITGIVSVNGAGTLIPSVGLGIAAAAVVGVNSWFRITPIGTNTATSTGNFN